jgi:hypothetical protein
MAMSAEVRSATFGSGSLREPTASRTALVVAGVCGAVAGASIFVHPLAPLGLSAAASAALLIVRKALLAQLFLVYLGLLLIGYAFFGRSFAHIGVAPVYLGEVALVLASLVLLRHWRRVGSLGAIEILLLAFMVLGAVHTVRFLPRDGVDALRDGVLWGYAFVAFAVTALLRREHFGKIADVYGLLAPAFIIWVVAGRLLSQNPSLPTIPGSDVSVISFKGGDMGVHLAGIAALVVVGLFLRGRSFADLGSAILIPLWVIAIAFNGSINRGGLFAAMVGWGAVFLVRPSRRWTLGIVLAGLVLSLVALADPAIEAHNRREISLDQIVANLSSTVLDTGDPLLDGTKHFRLRWWNDIVDYTVFGPYFLTGKGFGVNLADDDGYQIKRDRSLRAPHNSHLTVLARMGVPGFALWILVQLAFGIGLVRAYRAARRAGAVFWCRIDAWILAYWLAMLLNTSFDPYLEGPQGGIWFWAVIGMGLAAMRVQRGLTADPRAVRP